MLGTIPIALFETQTNGNDYKCSAMLVISHQLLGKLYRMKCDSLHIITHYKVIL